VRAFLGMGSNLGDSRRLLRDAVKALGESVTAVSPLYRTEPVGGPPGQPSYLNVVVELDTTLTPRELLGVCQALEAGAGREPGERWGPRTLDVDILLVDDLRVNEPDLVLPHPRMHERRFVMAPLADVAPDVVPPGWEERVEGFVERVGKL
jgi:2-amino-4-hydroxy-6-hydroxymethyldihydropteridine diphosphokinase